MKRLSVILLALCLVLCAVVSAGAEETSSGYTLNRVVVLSRHNIRSPLSEKGSLLSDITPHEWFAWTSEPSELSLRGAMLETTMGQYFRLWLEEEGLFPRNYIPAGETVRFYANGLQRTQATARYFSAGLLPVAAVPVECHVEYNETDSTFLPNILYMTDAYAADVRKEIAEAGGGEGLEGWRDKVRDAVEKIMYVTDMADSEAYREGKYGDLLNGDSELILEAGDEPRMNGAMKYALSLSDALVLQYYEEPDEVKAAFGHEMTEEDWKTVGSMLGAYEEILFCAPSLACNLAHPMLEEICREMNAEGRQFSFLCGHDSTLSSFLAALDVEDYELPGAVEPRTPIGSKVVFSRWLDEDGTASWKIEMVYQSTAQLRAITPLSLEEPPMIVPLSLKGAEAGADGMIPEEALMRLFEEKIAELDAIEERYEDGEALPGAA